MATRPPVNIEFVAEMGLVTSAGFRSFASIAAQLCGFSQSEKGKLPFEVRADICAEENMQAGPKSDRAAWLFRAGKEYCAV